MATETEEIKLEKDAVQPADLEETPEFKAWLESKIQECLRYLKLSFNMELPAEKLLFYPEYLGYPDPVNQLRSHARIWGYNYKIGGENVVNPATEQPMSYVVWQILDQPVVVTDPILESDQETEAEFDSEPA